MRKKTITLTPELDVTFVNLKQAVRIFEISLNRTINAIDIIGELDMAKLLNLDLVEDKINPGFDAYDGNHRIQIKATRAKTGNSRLSKILDINNQLDFDFIILAKYKHETDFQLEAVYKASREAIQSHFSYINSSEKSEKRVLSKKYRDISISQFISTAELVYNFTLNQFTTNNLSKRQQSLY